MYVKQTFVSLLVAIVTYYNYTNTVSDGNITFSGRGTIGTYQQAFASIVYFNGASEPTMNPVRQVQFQVFDGVFRSNVVTGFINVTLLNDNPLMLNCGAGMSSFIEDSETPIPLAGFLTLSDLDSNHIVSAASVIITNPQEGDEIQVDSSLAGPIGIQQSGGTRLALTGAATAMQYQVRV